MASDHFLAEFPIRAYQESSLSLRDHVGIDVGPDGDVWTTFMGISDVRDPDPDADKTLIWSTRIPW